MFKLTRSLSNASAVCINTHNKVRITQKVDELQENTLTGVAYRVCLVNENEALKWRDLENPLLVRPGSESESERDFSRERATIHRAYKRVEASEI